MKCYTHTADAAALWVYCGRALRGDCIQSPTAFRMVCLSDCAAALVRADQSMRMIVAAGLSATAAIVAWFVLPSFFLILFTSGCAMVLLISGLWRGHAKKATTNRQFVD